MVPAGLSYPTYGAGYVGVPARSYVPSVALPRHHLAPPAPPPWRQPAPPPGPPPVNSTAVAPSKATTECKQGPAAAAVPVQSGSQQQDRQAGISREASAASSSGANIACTDSSDAGSSAGDAGSPFAASTASTPRSAAESSLGSAGAAAAAAAAAAAGRCTTQHSAARAVSQGGSCAAQQAVALAKGFQKDPTSINSSNGCSATRGEKDAAFMAVQAAAKPVGALQGNHQGRPAAPQQLQGSAVAPSAANTKAGSAAQHRAAAAAAALAISGHKTPSHVRLQAAQHKQQEVPFSLRSIRLLPPPADAAAAKALQSEFQFRLFAHHSKYVLDLLQPAASAKLSCLIRLSAHDLTAILQEPQPEQLLDQVWDRHRSK